MSPDREMWMIAGLLTLYVILGVSLVIAAVRS
jgi:type IV secretory pathway TrbD component